MFLCELWRAENAAAEDDAAQVDADATPLDGMAVSVGCAGIIEGCRPVASW